MERRKKQKSYRVVKALFYIALLSMLLLELYRAFNKFAARGLKQWKVISSYLLSSFRHDDIREEKEYMERRTCMRLRLE